jgi:hypothetical protein
MCEPFLGELPVWQFAADWFGDCIYDRWDYVSFGVGVISMLCWTVALLPQVTAPACLLVWFLSTEF